MNYWLLKSEPYKYSYDQLVADGQTYWDGVRNYQARNFMQQMQAGDCALYYHSNKGKEVVGIAKIVSGPYQDPTTEDDRWVAVDVQPLLKLDNPVSLKQIKSEETLSEMKVVKQSRLSVSPVTKEEFDKVLELAGVSQLPEA